MPLLMSQTFGLKSVIDNAADWTLLMFMKKEVNCTSYYYDVCLFVCLVSRWRSRALIFKNLLRASTTIRAAKVSFKSIRCPLSIIGVQ